jgi:hypothetical protein
MSLQYGRPVDLPIVMDVFVDSTRNQHCNPLLKKQRLLYENGNENENTSKSELIFWRPRFHIGREEAVAIVVGHVWTRRCVIFSFFRYEAVLPLNGRLPPCYRTISPEALSFQQPYKSQVRQAHKTVKPRL